MQEKCLERLEKLFPDQNVRKSGDAILFNSLSVGLKDLNTLSLVEGMYKDITIKRSGKGVVIIIKF